MARTCSVCSHPDRKQIDGAIVEGMSYRDIARQFGIGRNAIANHAEKHLPASLVKATEASMVTHAGDLYAQLDARKARIDRLCDQAEKSMDIRAALQALKEWRGFAEFEAKMRGDLDERAVVNVTMSPQWLEIRSVLIDALQDHPTARLAVAEALARVDGIGSHDGR